MVMYRLRLLVSGEFAGAWAKFGGFGGQLCLLLNHLEACVARDTKVAARLSEEKCDLLPHMT